MIKQNSILLYLFIIGLFLLNSNESISQSINGSEFNTEHPKREMRGIFVPTVFNITWPSKSSDSPDKQKEELVGLLDNARSNGYNTIFLQIRPAGDALYKSDIEPWSNWLTGTEGKPPSPLWDPLEFAIIESHSRGMELHAWLNPYRVKYGSYKTHSTHVINRHPSWVFKDQSDPKLVVLDPGLPEVREYIVSIIKDISIRYDIDGIHFDDYFYPKGGMSKSPNNQDNLTYLNNNPESLPLEDWRRDNINKMISDVYDAIQIINKDNNKSISFGVSPFGIWKSGIPKGITGTSSYDALYCDPITWMKSGKVDYIAPQLYWKFGGKQDYDILSQWWNDQSKLYNVQLYVSQRYYGMGSSNWSPSEIESQIDKNRNESMGSTLGQIAYRYNEIKDNEEKINNILNISKYKYKSFVPPIMGDEKDNIWPMAPDNIRFYGLGIKWDTPYQAIDGDLPVKYVIYMFDDIKEVSTNKNDGTKILDITNSNEIKITENQLNTKFFVITSLDKNNNESGNFNNPLYKKLY